MRAPLTIVRRCTIVSSRVQTMAVVGELARRLAVEEVAIVSITLTILRGWLGPSCKQRVH